MKFLKGPTSSKPSSIVFVSSACIHIVFVGNSCQKCMISLYNGINPVEEPNLMHIVLLISNISLYSKTSLEVDLMTY